MKKRNREINIFNISMLDVIASAMGSFLIIMVVLLPYYSDVLKCRDEREKYQNAYEQCEEEKDRITRQFEEEKNRMIQQCEEEKNGITQRCEEEKNSITRQCEEDKDRITQQCEEERGKITQRCEEEKDRLTQQCEEDKQKLGFELKSKKTIFIVDISGSMEEDNKIRDVTSGIKMLIATMDESYQTDVVFFPNTSESKDYGYLWGEMRTVTEERKYEAYRFLSRLVAMGSTPTESVLEFVLSHREYEDAGTLILLSDGVPAEGTRALSWGELEGLIARITTKNRGEKIINTIGVGEDFRDPYSTTDAVKFLRNLAQKNKGFYVGY